MPPPSLARAWFLAIRPRTLPASIVPVAVGLAVARRGHALDIPVAVATMVAAMLLQVAANLANDVADFERGVDTAARLGPPRATHQGWLSPRSVKAGAWIAVIAAAACGTWLVAAGGVIILVLGLLLIAVALGYSVGPRPLSGAGLGEVLAFVFFGPVAICGTVYLQRGGIGWDAVVASLPVACLVAAIMVVNNLRDIPTDRATGKHTLAVRLGPARTRTLYGVLVHAAYIACAGVAALTTPGALLPFVSVPLGVREVRAVRTRSGPALNQSLAGTARLVLVVGLLLVVGLWW